MNQSMPQANLRYVGVIKASACADEHQVGGAAWSASPNANNSDNAWNVNFNNGNDNNDNKSNGLSVRLVRSGQWGPDSPAAPVAWRDLHDAWQSARRRKKPSHNQLAFENGWIDSISSLQERVNRGAWWPSPPVCFITTQPKAREIHAPDFSDRVLHHWLVPQLEAIFEPSFIHDSYSNQAGKGTHLAVRRLQQFERQLQGGAGCGQAHYLQLDIHNFFNSIHRPTLYAQLSRKLKSDGDAQQHTLRWLCHRLLAKPPAEKVHWRASLRERAQVPPHKRLAEAAPGCGLPIGNLTSQFFANVYLNALDQFVKHQLKCRHYLRYVDDFVLLHEDAEQLQIWQKRIEDFLQATLRLKLKPEIKRGSVAEGVDFLGYHVFPTHLTVRPRVAQHALERLAALRQPRNTAQAEQLRSAVASYWGHFSHGSAQKLRNRLLQRQPWLKRWFRSAHGIKPAWRKDNPIFLFQHNKDFL